ncbi:extracellular solute-binding protein [Marinobacterium jannaschii]|uniref:extracellular solute-binding protein n=1 Tax=Marinobacterium jannaschii TaxID=64970 RepID=UPI000559E914|nr:extracellular solute-binding protein [Marinobacterium jannaschii]
MKLIKSILTGTLLTVAAIAGTAYASSLTQHGIAMHGDLKYGPDFPHFDYVNPNAPKGGKVIQSTIGTFDSFNPFIVKGNTAPGLGLMYDSLLARANDEPFSLYGLIAESLEVAQDRSWVIFNLRPEARFNDGSPITPDDIIYTFKLLREQGAPGYRAYYADISSIEAIDEDSVKFTFSNSNNKELALIVGEASILPKHYWQKREFQKPSLDIPLGSGPYTIEKFEPGRSITFRRNEDYWAENLPVNIGRHNYDQIQYDVYLDGTVALEAFKAGEFDFTQENSSKRWATSYTGPGFKSGKIIKTELPHQNPTGMQAFVMNTRRPLFTDSTIRQALGMAFDFEWTNKNLFYNAYTRTHSFFSNSEMAATALPTPAELEILEPIRDQVPPEVFTKVYRAPTTDGNGKIRRQLRQALRMLKAAGWTLKQGKLINTTSGKQFKFELLMFQPSMERVAAPFLRNLERMGIEVSIRMVDVSQYINRLRSTDFDMVVYSFPQSNSPGNEQRDFWSSAAADSPGSRNLIGIKNPAVDHLVEKLIQASSREQLVLTSRALDRVLQWNHYVIPQFHISSYRIAYRNIFGMPEQRPAYSLGFDTWWIRPETLASKDSATD